LWLPAVASGQLEHELEIGDNQLLADVLGLLDLTGLLVLAEATE
jgi:hypothetical protein